MLPPKKCTPIVSTTTFRRSQILGSDLWSGGALEFKPDFLDECPDSVSHWTRLTVFLCLSLSMGDNQAEAAYLIGAL